MLWSWDARQGDAEKARALGSAPVIPRLWKVLLARAAYASIGKYCRAVMGHGLNMTSRPTILHRYRDACL